MLYSIQLCRAIAALLVVFFHSAGNLAKEKYFGAAALPLEKIFWFGGVAGVDFFFVLSGFIIYHAHDRDFENPQRLLPYLRKRAIRIYPAYIIIFLAVFILAKATPSLANTVPSDLIIILKSLLLLPQDSKVVGGTGAPVIIAAWSLQYEMVFYVFFSLAIIRRWLFSAAAAILVVNMLLETALGPYEFPRSFLANHLILLFGMGLLAGALVKHKIHLSPSACSGLAIISFLTFLFVALIATWNRYVDRWSAIDLAYGIASGALIFSLARLEKDSTFMRKARRLSVFGDASYALYLLHFPLVAILSRIAVVIFPKSMLGVVYSFLFLVIGSLAAAVAFHLAIERPILRRLTPTTPLPRNASSVR